MTAGNIVIFMDAWLVGFFLVTDYVFNGLEACFHLFSYILLKVALDLLQYELLFEFFREGPII